MPPARSSDSKESTAGESDFVVVANRLPIDMERLPDGSTTWKRSPGGLVTALEPLLRRRHGAWVGWPGIVDGDEEPIDAEELRLHPVRLSADDVAEYYEGFSNATLWPLYHDVIVKPIYQREMVGPLRRRQPPIRQGGLTCGGQGGNRLGAGLPVAAGA